MQELKKQGKEMFYGNFSDERKPQFREALKNFKGIFKRVYAQDNLITFNRNLTFFSHDKKFEASFNKNAKTEQEKSLAWRLHTLCWASKLALKVPGDFVECGVWHGFSFQVITDYLDFGQVPKQLYLYDTYEGIPESYNSENRSNGAYANDKNVYEKVVERFSPMRNVQVVKGTVPDSFAQACPDKIALLHIDMNSSKSEIAALACLFDRVSLGGIIIFDDFGWLGYDKQTVAEIDFMRERGHEILELPTGQGMMIKT